MRDDIYTGYTDDSPSSWQEVRDRVKATLHPEQENLGQDGKLAPPVAQIPQETPKLAPSEPTN